jgi:type II secretory pathway component PulM
MKEWWLNLNLREKQTISIGIIIAIIGLIYALIWSPLHHGVISLRDQMQHNQKLLVWMQAADQQIQEIEKTGKKPTAMLSTAAYLSTIQNSLKQSPIANNITQLAQADHDSIKLNFQQVDFDLFISWLTELWQQHGFIITQLVIKSSNTPGMVTAEFILKK